MSAKARALRGASLGDFCGRAPLYAAGLTTGAAFGVLFAGRAPYAMIGAAVVGLLVGSAGRYRFVLLPLTAVLYPLLTIYGLPPVSPEGWRALILRIGGDLQAAAELWLTRTVPLDPGPGIVFILILVVMTLVAFATSATLYGGRPVITVGTLGLTLGILGTVSFESGIALYFTLFLPSAVLVLLFSGASKRPTRGSLALAALVTALVLVLPSGPLAEAAIRPALVDWQQLGQLGGVGPPRLDVQADVGNYLNNQRETELFRVKSEEPLLWRGGTLDRFEGVRWSSTALSGGQDGQEIAPGVETRRVEQSVRLSEARTNLIFGGYRIASVSGVDADRRSDGSWTLAEPLSDGSWYRVVSEVPQPTGGQLQGAGTDYPAVVREKFLQLPRSLPREVPETARRIENDYDPRTPYEKARAIERYLLYDGGFVYNLDVDYGRADRAIEKFLGEGREGFCVQFATSMALIAREMGVPSRVVYGAHPGEEVSPGEYAVYGKNLHTWVEIYFPGVGWYPFDPTPGFGLPAAMAANAPRSDSLGVAGQEAPVPDNRFLREEVPVPEPDRAQQQPVESLKSAVRENSWSPIAPAAYLLIFAGLSVGVVPLLKRALAARGTPEALYRDIAGRLEDALWPELRGPDPNPAALTPTERLVVAAKAGGLNPRPFEELAAAYSEHLYSPAPLADVWKPYRRAVREIGRLPRRRRVTGALNPASLARGVGQKSTVMLLRRRRMTHKTLTGGRGKP